MGKISAEFPTEIMQGKMPSSELLHRVALVRTDFSEEHIASTIRVTGIAELATDARCGMINISILHETRLSANLF
jgi:hypothetical protein